MVPDQIVLYAKIENWPTTYSRVSINVKTADQVMFLGHATVADCDYDRESAIRLGLWFIRQGDAVTFARVTVNRELLDSGRLSDLPKNMLQKMSGS